MIRRHKPEFPKELIIAILVCIYFFSPQLFRNIDTSFPFDHTRFSQSRDVSKQLDRRAKNVSKSQSADQKNPLDQSKKQIWPKKLSVKLNQKQEKQFQSDSKAHQTDQSIQKKPMRFQNTEADHPNHSDLAQKYKSKFLIGQVGGKVSAASRSSYSDYRDQHRLIELNPKGITAQKDQKNSSNALNRSDKGRRLNKPRSLSQSRRQELRNKAYLLGVHTHIQANDFPPALRALIKSK